MSSHAIVHVFRHIERADVFDIQCALACGCVVIRQIDKSRIALDGSGKPFFVGKYPCPNQHPVTNKTPIYRCGICLSTAFDTCTHHRFFEKP